MLGFVGERWKAEGRSAAGSVVDRRVFGTGSSSRPSTLTALLAVLLAFITDIEGDRAGTLAPLPEIGVAGECPIAALFDQSDVVPSPVFAVFVVVAVAGDAEGTFVVRLSGIARRGRSDKRFEIISPITD